MRPPIQASPVNRVAEQSRPQSGGITPSATGPCYFHHSCPADGYINTTTKRRCRQGGGYSWLNPRGGCENLR
jgi:hypothetical protein